MLLQPQSGAPPPLARNLFASSTTPKPRDFLGSCSHNFGCSQSFHIIHELRKFSANELEQLGLLFWGETRCDGCHASRMRDAMPLNKTLKTKNAFSPGTRQKQLVVIARPHVTAVVFFSFVVFPSRYFRTPG